MAEIILKTSIPVGDFDASDELIDSIAREIIDSDGNQIATFTSAFWQVRMQANIMDSLTIKTAHKGETVWELEL